MTRIASLMRGKPEERPTWGSMNYSAGLIGVCGNLSCPCGGDGVVDGQMHLVSATRAANGVYILERKYVDFRFNTWTTGISSKFDTNPLSAEWREWIVRVFDSLRNGPREQ